MRNPFKTFCPKFPRPGKMYFSFHKNLLVVMRITFFTNDYKHTFLLGSCLIFSGQPNCFSSWNARARTLMSTADKLLKSPVFLEKLVTKI